MLNLSGYKLTFDDEFNAFSASPPGGNTTWETAYFYGARSFPGDQTTLIDGSVGGLGETPFSLSNGVLNIHAQETTPSLKAAGVTTPYTGGQIDTHNTFSQQYGYFEMRAQLSGTPGTHTAFWMMPMAGAWPPEIDIQETLGSYPTYLMQTNHYNASNPSEQHQYTTVADTSKGFHTYGLKWTPTTLTFYFDDQETFTTPTQADEHQPMYMLVSEYAGLWAGTPVPGFGADYKIDWVRAYSSDSATNAISGQAGYQDRLGSSSGSGSAVPAPPVDPAPALTSTPGSQAAGGGAATLTTMVVQDDRGVSANVPVITSGSNQFTGPLGTTITQTVAGGVDTVSFDPHVIKETLMLGSGVQNLSFIAPNALILTGGSGTGTVKADSGPSRNLFTAGTGSLDVTGGSDGSTYIFHANSGQLKIEDFGFVKGDSITVDRSLNGAFTSSSDGHGGSLLSFGTAGSINVVGQSGLTASNINWA